MAQKNIIVLTGAGVSAESGIKTFRDADGLWEGHNIMQVATPEGWRKDPALVLKFYNDRRRQLLDVKPNAAHEALVLLEKHHKVTIITQNVDDLHERAGSSRVIHLHGELRKARSVSDSDLIVQMEGDINLGDKGTDGEQLRPHIVWFGEDVPLLELAAHETIQADCVLVIGSSMQVYPAASLVSYAPPFAPVFYIDPKPALNYEMSHRKNLTIVPKPATEGVLEIVEKLIADFA